MPKSAFKLTICGVPELNELATQPITHLISIWHPAADRDNYTKGIQALFPNAEVLFVVFDDIEQIIDDFDNPPCNEHVRDILEFGKKITKNSVVGIHCMAGISRSSATAMLLLSQHLGPGKELQTAEYIKQLRPQARPNRLIIQLADEILERNGALIHAVDTTFGASDGTRNKGWN